MNQRSAAERKGLLLCQLFFCNKWFAAAKIIQVAITATNRIFPSLGLRWHKVYDLVQQSIYQ